MLLDLSQELPPLTAEETYTAFLNSLQFRAGFGIIFLRCSPAAANQLISRVQQELPDKNIKVLELIEPINNLYKLVESRADRTDLNILFVRGLEKSLLADIKPGYKGLGGHYNLNTVPPILSHLNQQRENFRDHFGNICFVFVLPKFAIRYFFRRAPDFYDWNSGVFEISDSKNYLKVLPLSESFENSNWYNKGNSLFNMGRYEEAIESYDQAIAIQENNYGAWNSRGDSLSRLGRYEEAIVSYDSAIAIKIDLSEAWFSRGIVLDELGRYEEAVESYNRAVTINPDLYEAWLNRGWSLFNLRKYEESINSYDRAISFKADLHEAWYCRGISLQNLGRSEEAITSYECALAIKPDNYEAWNIRGLSLRILGKYQEEIESYDRAIAIKPDNDVAWNNRGDSLHNLGRYEEAITSYNRAIAIKPDEFWYIHNKGWSYFKRGMYQESITCFDQSITIRSNKYDTWHCKGLVEFVASDYPSALTSWEQSFNYIVDPKVPRYQENISVLIQEFIEELIPRFTQPPIQQTLLIPLLEIYKKSNVITELGAALVNTLHLIVAPTISDHTAAEWLSLWRTSSLGNEPAMELPLRLMSTSIEYKKDPSKRQRLWLNLPSEERPILDKALKLLD
jgi:tetratricopeptide (TPR) repeat protein